MYRGSFMRRICSVGAILVLILVTFTGVIFAKKIDLSMAQQIGAVQLRIRKQIRLTQALPPVEYSIQTVRLLKDTETREVLAYILDLKPKGFVAISTDTDIKPVIAYSYHSSFSMEDVRANVLLHMLKQDMKNRLEVILLTSERLKSTNRQLWERYLSEEKSRALVVELADAEQWPEDDRGWLGAVGITWKQTGSYNNSCPKDPTSFWGFRCVVGCAAVAMGQIIYYWQYPDSVSFDSSDGYVSEYDSERVIRIDEDHALYDFPSFDELNAKLENIGYSGNQQEIADFLFACGIAVKMQYSSEGSRSTSGRVETALKDKFGYQANWKFGSGYDFYEVLENDMKGARPAYLGVMKQNAEVGHAIVADGFRSTGEFHLNFGGGANYPDPIGDAWYSLPEGMPDGYTIVSVGILGIRPKEENQPPSTPPLPTGPDSGNPGTSYDFTANTTDPDGDQVAFKFDWGDESQSNWTDFVNSGEAAGDYHSWSSEGTYKVKVKAKDTQGAESDWSPAHQIEISRANQPPNTPSYPSPSDGAANQSIDVDLGWTGGDPDSDPVTYDVYFKANDSNFGEPVSPGQSGTTYDPGTLSYDTHYYWKIVATDNHGASTDGPVWDFTMGSSGRHENEVFSLPAGKWKMISIPFTLDDPSPNAVLVDDLGEQSDAVWKLYRWNAANGSYDKYPYTGDFAAAKAFWIISKDAKEVDTGPGTDVSRETDFVINLPSGWSQIGNPFPFSVAWGEVMVRKDGEVISISEAQGKEWVRDTIWYWDGQSYLFAQAPSGVLNPYEGHWVRALLNCELLVPPSEAQEARAWEQVIKSKEEFLQLKARVSHLKDNYNFLGFYQTAKDGYDRLDVEEAPPISPYISLFFPHPEWGKNKGDYTQDIRARIPQATRWIWDFQVKTDQINREIVLEWENTLAFPEELHLYLTDSFSNVLANMREKSSYSLISSSGLESFKIIVSSETLPLPEELHLSEIYSYPNPAHGEGVKFHFYLASAAKLTIKIYSISGELVRTLIKDEVYFPGAYEEFWKEDNDRGEKLARGLYIFIIQAGNPAKVMSKSGKIVLLD